jgi:hypothetical protein
MRRLLAVAVALVAVFGMVVPAMAQAPAPKVTINGTIDQMGTATSNMSQYDADYGRARDDQLYGRTRGRFDIVGEVGRAKAVLGLEIDAYYGQTSNSDRNVPAGTTAASNQGFGANGGLDINTDVAGIIEIKWLYTEFPMFLIPDSTMRLGAQPFGSAATYKLAAYANGDFAGVNWVTRFGPVAALNLTYVQIEEELTGADFYAASANTFRGEDWAIIASFDFSPFKGLDIKPMYSYAHIAGITNGATRQGRGGIPNAAAAFRPTDVEARHTLGVDARWTAGPISLHPTILYQFGSRDTVADEADISAWFFDVRAGFQVGPLTLSAMAMYTSGNKASDDLTDKVRFYQPLSTDTSYGADWGTQIFSLGIDYFNILYAQVTGLNPGVAIGYDRYGRYGGGVKAAYAFTPALTLGVGVTSFWTARKVDTDSTLTAAAGLTPGAGASGDERWLGAEANLGVTYRFAPGVTFDLAGGYLFAGDALGYTSARASTKDPEDVALATARVRFSF